MRIHLLPALVLLTACTEVPGDPLDTTSPSADAGVTSSPDASTADASTTGTPDAGTVEPPMPFDPLVDALRRAAASCDRSRRCDPEAFLIRWGTDPDACVDDSAAALLEVRRGIWRRAGYRQIDDAIRAGRVRFEREAFEECIEGFRTAACGELYRCASPFSGAVAPRDACHIDEECSGDRYCDSERMIECGTCQDRLGAGEDANRFGMCTADSFFGLIGCFALAAEGEPCSRFLSGSVRALCGPGFFCAGETDIGICAREIRRGGACDESFECEGTGLCIENVCVEPILRNVGERCETRDVVCVGDLHCSGDRICETLPVAGEECTFGSRCADDSFCGGRTCEAYASVGEGCPGLGAVDERCETGAVCSEALRPLCTRYVWTMCGG